ncbi:helix-turn-helix transcriptional regulator [Cohnella sp. JJ-181]|uniref:helix-turn-helix transcriptional regulator n=1 Tax=Cohnella rhizoplanae TaxID=2974897 RepID=UPI0022FF70BB|nr:AraC family transcriptional regulator [Cohnella sp. JJ-181]CAI6087599.1 Arabinose operon regulatory protein [Cohnella sp. JJ-181]
MLPLFLNRPYRLRMGGHFLSDENWSHMDRIISEYELIIGVSGVVFLEAGGNMYEIREGDVLFLVPGERHRGYRLSTPGVSFYWFHFLEPDAASAPAGKMPKYANCPNASRVHILARQLLHAANGGYRIEGAGDYFLTCLLIELADQLQDSGGGRAMDAQLHELLAWTRMHALDPDITVGRIAGHMGYNKDYLSRMFKRRFGSGLLDYIHGIRLEAAKQLLAGGKLGVKEIAGRVGFGDDKQFAKWFKRLAGVTPTAYRQAFGRTLLNNR